MAAPTWVSSGAGVVTATGTSTVGNGGGLSAEDLLILQVLQDGTAASAVTIAPTASVKNLAGTTSAMTLVTGSPFNVGSPTAALQHLWIGRVASGIGCTVDVTTTGDDLYSRLHVFTSVNAGSALSDVIENSSAGSATNGVGTSVTVSDTGVTTLGPDRLACNFVGINDDATGLAAFAGETGGDWVLPVAIFESATGTDGTIALMTAAMPSAGTIDGGSDAITIDGWGVVGFALIGTTPAAPRSRPARRRSIAPLLGR